VFHYFDTLQDALLEIEIFTGPESFVKFFGDRIPPKLVICMMLEISYQCNVMKVFVENLLLSHYVAGYCCTISKGTFVRLFCAADAMRGVMRSRIDGGTNA